MEEQQKINLRKHQLPKFKGWHTVRFILYLIVISGVVAYLWYAMHQSDQPVPVRDRIEGFEIDVDE